MTDPFTVLVQACQSVWLVRIYDGSDAPSVAFAVGTWLGVHLAQTALVPPLYPLHGLRTSRYRGVGPFHVHRVGKELRLPSDYELSRFMPLPAIPSLGGASFG
jgi:hypothetical protein